VENWDAAPSLEKEDANGTFAAFSSLFIPPVSCPFSRNNFITDKSPLSVSRARLGLTNGICLTPV